MASERSKSPHSVPPPPRVLELHKFAESRAPELESLLSVVANRLNNDFRSRRNKRRRTTGFDNRVAGRQSVKRQKLRQVNKEGISGGEDGEKKVSRRIRRRMEFKKNPETGFCTLGDGTKRLRTHVWHAKRFTMVKRWGFCLPLGLHGRGRGSRAVLKWLKCGALLHDASYSCAVQLEGLEDSILTILRMVMVPLSSLGEQSQPVIRGLCGGSAMLHHAGARLSKLIAPVTYMWRPYRDQTDIGEGDNFIMKTSPRQMWIWIHAAAFDEGFYALKSACQELEHKNGVSISCFSRDGQLAKLEVMGAKAAEILRNILHPVFASSSTSMDHQLKLCSSLKTETNTLLKKGFLLAHLECLPPSAVLSLTVQDPRDLPVKDDFLEENNSKEFVASTSGALNDNLHAISSLWVQSAVDGVHLSDNEDLWPSNDRMNPPTEENFLCQEKHQRRLSFFYLDGPKRESLDTECTDACGRSCPILLLKNNSKDNSLFGWSIILPLSWVKALWIPLTTKGAHAIGLRERQWVACNDGVPFFPNDFPDCKAYSDLMAVEAAASVQTAELRPLAVRPLRVPIPPPWDCVKLFGEEWPTGMRENQTLGERLNGSQMACGMSEDQVQGNGACFVGFVARTSKDLSNFLSEICGKHLLLFTNTYTGKKSFSELMDNGMLSWVPKEIKQFSLRRKLCFLRVLLHAYKEGAFEEGAVVCAPVLADLSLWTSRSGDEHKLQIPQSSIRSYFVQQQSGKWELQILEDPVARLSHRWPIGFVTTGFVRGSTKPVASALCEATLLARMRQEQWSQLQEKGRHEIFVLVRNLRSSAYRLALATLVLEEQEEDVMFM